MNEEKQQNQEELKEAVDVKEDAEVNEADKEVNKDVQEETEDNVNNEVSKEDVQDKEAAVQENPETNDDKSDEVNADVSNKVEKEEEEKGQPLDTEQVEDDTENLRAELEELRFQRDEGNALKALENLEVQSNYQLNAYTQSVQKALNEGLQTYGIDPNKSIAELQQENPAQAELAQQFLKAAQDRVMEKHQELTRAIQNAESTIVFTRAEREIKKFNLSTEQQKAACDTFVDIFIQTGVSDLTDDLKAKVKLAVAQAMMDIPTNAKPPVGVVEVKADTNLENTLPDEEEEKQKEKPEEKVVTPPPAKQEVDVEDFKAAANASDTKMEVSKEPPKQDVLAVLQSLPYNKRVEYMLEHKDEIDEAMRNIRLK